MKAFICALILLATVTAGCFWGSYKVTATVDVTVEKINGLPRPKDGADLRLQEDALKEIFTEWEDSHFLMQILVNHPIKLTLDEQFRMAIGYCEADDAEEYTASIQALKNSLHLLREISEVSWLSIL